MKKRATLQLNIYLKYGKNASLVFKKEGMLCRINNLINSKVLVANMAQLDRAIQTGARQHCHEVLNGTRNRKWLLHVAHNAGVVVLEVSKYLADDSVEQVFNWTDGAEDFRHAVRGLCLTYQLSGMHRYGKK